MSSGPLTRRDALRLGGAAAASLVLTPAMRTAAATWKPIPIGTQLWCVRAQLAKDIPGTLKALGALGYQAVELENAFSRSGAEWKGYLDAANLKACGFHHRLSELQGDQLARKPHEGRQDLKARLQEHRGDESAGQGLTPGEPRVRE